MHISLIPNLTTALAVGACALALLSGAEAQCGQSYQRKEIRDLSQAEFNRFADAIKALHAGPSPTRFDKYAEIHLRYQVDIHNNAHFFPWHRKFILEFEHELQGIDPSVTLPYWDWSQDATYPWNSPVLQPSLMGGNSFGQCVTSGAFAGFQRYFPTPGCLRRQYAEGDRIGRFASPTLLNLFRSRATSYDEFRASIEVGPHAGPHVGVGADMSTMQSPADPLFFLHHAFIDKIWHDWQMYREDRRLAYNGIYRGRNVGLDDMLLNYDTTSIRSLMDISSLCYSYAPMQSRNVARADAAGRGSGDRNLVRRADDKIGGILNKVASAVSEKLDRIFKLTHLELLDIAKTLGGRMEPPTRIPDSFIEMNHYNKDEVRAQEAAIEGFVKQVNEVYKSLPAKR